MEFFLNLLRSVAYGIIEGVTEWLPISSTGHMILAEQVLKFSFSAEFMEMFRVVIQLGAILAVVVLYFKKLWPFCADNGRDSGFSRHFRWPVVRLWCKIIVACVPAASQFTFFLAIPVMAGASGLKLVKFLAKGGVFTLAEISALLVGCIVAFVVSMLAIRFLMNYVKKHTFTAFGWYRIALGIVVLGIWALQTFVLA